MDDKDHIVKCPVCDFSTKNKQHSKGHMTKHKKRNSFNCTKCTKKFAQESALKQHMNAQHKATAKPPVGHSQWAQDKNTREVRCTKCRTMFKEKNWMSTWRRFITTSARSVERCSTAKTSSLRTCKSSTGLTSTGTGIVKSAMKFSVVRTTWRSMSAQCTATASQRIKTNAGTTGRGSGARTRRGAGLHTASRAQEMASRALEVASRAQEVLRRDQGVLSRDQELSKGRGVISRGASSQRPAGGGGSAAT